MKFFNNLSGRQRAFALILLLFIIIAGFTFFSSDPLNKGIVSGLFVVLLWFTRPIWLPENYGRTAVRKASLTVALAAVAGFYFWEPILYRLAKPIIDKLIGEESTNPYVEHLPPAIAFIFLLGVILIVNFFTRDKTAMGIHEDAMNKDIPEPRFDEKLTNVVDSLFSDLRQIDIQTRWSPSQFTRLEAEVEVITPNGAERKITDLLNAIKKSKDRVFLVLGDPGAGKSVALRKLAQDLCQEVDKTGKVPVYVNLKEWEAEEVWTEENPPTVHELNEFVLANLKDRDIVTSKFFDKYYERLYETGRLYFIFDSFDEIPAVLDERENSELIKILSHVIFKFLKGARSKESQGILASRIFRKPTRDFQARTTLEIRPFSEEKVRHTLRKSTGEEVINDLFKNRPDLLPMARNPFSSMLVSEFVEHQKRLPNNKSELFENYIDQTLQSCISRVEDKGLSIPEIKSICRLISIEMFETYGLEVPVDELKRKYSNKKLEETIGILKFVRLGRVGSGDDNRFSFAHRRFAEYFVVQHYLNEGKEFALDSIPTDSQYRDALVLYCEVAPFEKGVEIAKFCWEEINRIDDLTNIEAIHCLRFLKDAFVGRYDYLESFSDSMFNYLFKEIKKDNSLLIVKVTVESLGLFDEEKRDAGVSSALHLNNSWINEAAFKACRNLSVISPNLSLLLKNFLLDLPINTLLNKYSELSFSLSLSDAIIKFRRVLVFRVLYSVSVSFLVILLFFINPIVIVLYLPTVVMYSLILISANLNSSKNVWKNLEVYKATSQFSFLLFSIYIFFLWLLEKFGSLKGKELEVFLDSIGFMEVIPSTARLMIFTLLSFLIIFPSYKLLLIDRNDVSFRSLKKVFNQVELDFSKFGKELLSLLASLVLAILFLSMFIGLTYFVASRFDFEFHTKYLFYLFVLYVFFVLLKRIINDFKNRKAFMKAISTLKASRVTRKDVESAFSIASSMKNKERLISYIENNVKEVSGEWENKEILYVSRDEVTTRLAKLEEKWLGLDR